MTILFILFTETINLGASLRGYMFSILLVWVALATILSLLVAVRSYGIPLMKCGRPLASLTATVLYTIVSIVPTMSFMTIKLIGGYERR